MTRTGKGELIALLAAAVGAIGIAFVQPQVDLHRRKVKAEADTASIPPAAQLKVMALGYNAAVADMLWASLLVEHGIHSHEHRGLNGVPRYLDGIATLDPGHPMVYDYVDTLLVTAKPGGDPTPEDARIARAFFERGTREHPYDASIWLHYGQFITYLAPSVLTDKNEIARWRRDGAFALTQAVSLGADADRSLAASTILSGAGEKKAAIEQLQRAYAVTDNEETRLQIRLKLERLEASYDAETATSRVEQDWHAHFPFLTRGEALLIGPARSTTSCAGPSAARAPKCAGDWSFATRR